MSHDLEITYRSCRIEDADEVLALWRRSGAVPGSTDTRAAILTRLERDADLFILAEAEGQLIGTVIGGWDGWRGNIYRLVVDPAHRRRGIAARLVEMVEENLARTGARRVYALAVRAELDPGATAFWEARGYSVNPRVAPYSKWIGGT